MTHDLSAKSGTGAAPEAPGKHLLAELFSAVRNLTYAGIGIVGAVGEEAEATYRRSIQRGHSRVRKVEARLGLRDAEPFTLDGVAVELPKKTSAELRAMLTRLNLADPADLDALRRQLAELEEKIDKLSLP